MKKGYEGLLALLLCLSAIVPGSAHAAWLQAKSKHFIIYSEGSEGKLRDFAQKLEKFDFLLRHIARIDDTVAGSPVRVYLLNSDLQIMQLARNRNVRGFYNTSDRFAYAVLPRDGKADEFDLGAQEILFHEYSHHFMLHHFPAAYPAWYIEGFAEFFSAIKFPKDGAIEFGNIPMYRAPGLVYASPYPLKLLLARTTGKLGAMEGDRYYGTAWLLTHYFQYRPDRRAEISRYLMDIAKGVPDMKLDSYFAGGIDGLEKDLRAYMRKPLAASRLAPQSRTIAEITISPVDPAQGALIDDELRLMRKAKPEELTDILSSVRQTAAKYPGSAYALAVLAEAEAAAEQKDAALADADRAIAIDPALSRAYSTRARLLLNTANESGKGEDWGAARTAIVKANRADTEDPVPLHLYYRYNVLKGGPVPEVAIDGLYKAFQLLPQHDDYRVALSHALAGQGKYAAASRLLNPLAYSPHASESRDAALQLKAQYDAAAMAQPEPSKKSASAAP
jgi:hypothetical protein